MRYANEIATWGAILSIMIGGGIWVGAQGSDTKANTAAIEKTVEQVDKLRNDTPPAIAVLQTQVSALATQIGEVKSTQEKILDEVRKK